MWRGAVEERVETSVDVSWSYHHVERDETREQRVGVQSGELEVGFWGDDDVDDWGEVEGSNPTGVGSETIKMTCENGLVKALLVNQ